MALNNFKCNHLMPLHFKGLMYIEDKAVAYNFLDKLSIDCIRLYCFVETNKIIDWLLMTDIGLDGQFDVLCQYLGLPTSLSVLFSQSDVLRHLFPRSAVLFCNSLYFCHLISACIFQKMLIFSPSLNKRHY